LNVTTCVSVVSDTDTDMSQTPLTPWIRSVRAREVFYSLH